MPDYDIFISYKSTDDNGLPSEDSAMAESLYFALQKKGYNPFFSKYSIDNVGRSDYITLINDAIESVKIFVAVGTSRKHLTSRWVKREISMFSALMMQAEEGDLTLLTYRSPDLPVGELPANLADLQSFADEKALIRFIDVSLSKASAFCNDENNAQLLFNTLPNAGRDPIKHTPTVNKTQGLKIGDRLDGRYIILSKIGQGGMSNIYLAINERTNKEYAIKEIRADSVLDFSSVLMSLRAETDIMKRLSHPAIPEIVDILESEDSFNIVMEYVEGYTLNRTLDNSGTLSEEDVKHIAKQMADVLKYLHSQPLPIIHRDIKPENIILKPNGNVKLLDFGTAREQKQHSLSDTTCLGTIGYAAPEQYGGMGQTDCRTDIYCLGATLYHLVTGNSPAKPPYEILPIRDVKPDLSKGLEYIIQKCTQKDPDSRYQTAEELLYDLEHINKLSKRTSAFSFAFNKKTNRSKSKNIPEKVHTYTKPDISTPYSGAESKPMPILPSGVNLENLKFETTADTTVLFSQSPEHLVNSKANEEEALSKFSSLDPHLQKIIIDLINHLADESGNK